MKKAICLLLVLVMATMLAGCGEVSKTKKMIDAIGTVTLESEESIKAAQQAYDALKDEEKAKVENISVLNDAQEMYTELLKEKAYNDAEAAFQKEDFKQAQTLFKEAADYKDAAEKVKLSEKAEHYQKAGTAFTGGQFDQAESEFKLADDYKDAAARAEESAQAGQYTEAVEMVEQGKYREAIEAFSNAAGYKDTDQKLIEVGNALLDKKAYTTAATAFDLSQDAAGKSLSKYAQAQLAFGNEDYDGAKKLFTSVNSVRDSADMINICTFMQAEISMAEGKLNTAKDAYQSLPEGFSYNNIQVVDRLAKLEKFNNFVELCGVWKSNEMDASVRQTHKSTGLWDQWDGKGWGYTLEITCVLNDDDTASMKAKANFWHYTNYSSLSKYLKNADDYCIFTYTGATVPAKMDYSLNFNYEYSGTLKIQNKTFKLDYQILDKNSSMNFSYTYKSFGTYDTFVKAL